jgi:hypothetical protein
VFDLRDSKVFCASLNKNDQPNPTNQTPIELVLVGFLSRREYRRVGQSDHRLVAKPVVTIAVEFQNSVQDAVVQWWFDENLEI